LQIAAAMVWHVQMDENGRVGFHSRFRKMAVSFDSRKRKCTWRLRRKCPECHGQISRWQIMILLVLPPHHHHFQLCISGSTFLVLTPD